MVAAPPAICWTRSTSISSLLSTPPPSSSMGISTASLAWVIWLTISALRLDLEISIWPMRPTSCSRRLRSARTLSESRVCCISRVACMLSAKDCMEVRAKPSRACLTSDRMITVIAVRVRTTAPTEAMTSLDWNPSLRNMILSRLAFR